MGKWDQTLISELVFFLQSLQIVTLIMIGADIV